MDKKTCKKCKKLYYELEKYSCGDFVCPFCVVDDFILNNYFGNNKINYANSTSFSCKCIQCGKGSITILYDKWIEMINTYIKENDNVMGTNNDFNYKSDEDFTSYLNRVEEELKEKIERINKDNIKFFNEKIEELKELSKKYSYFMKLKLENVSFLFKILHSTSKILYNEKFITTLTYDINNIIIDFSQGQEEFNLLKSSFFHFSKFIEENDDFLSFAINTTQYIKNPIYSTKSHKGNVYSLLKLPNNYLASCSDDKTIKIWNFDTMSLHQTLIGHKSSITNLIKLHSSDIMVSSSNDNTLKIWSMKTGECLNTLSPHNKKTVFSLCPLSPNYFASSSSDKTIVITDGETYEKILTIRGHKDSVYDVIQLKNSYLCSCSGDRTVKIWKVDYTIDKSFKCIQTLLGHSKPVFAICEYKQGQIASASGDNLIKLWNIQKGECIGELKGHLGGVNTIIAMQDGSLVSGGDDKIIRVWDMKYLYNKAVIIGHKGTINSIVLMDKGILASGSIDKTIKVWKLENNDENENELLLTTIGNGFNLLY